MGKDRSDQQNATESELRQQARDASARSTQAYVNGDQAGHEAARNESLAASNQAYGKYWNSRTGK
jgi:hypothetical protein